MLRVLVSAYACEPERGSEPGVGWNWALQIANFSETSVITRANNRDAIEAELAKHPVPGLRFIYFDLPRALRFWKKGRRGLRLYYYLWQLGAYFVARRLHARTRFHLAHHVTFVSYWAPSFLAFLPIPFVLGPVGGGESAPRQFWKSFSLRGMVYELARDFARKLVRFDPLVRLTLRRAATVLATTEETAERLRHLGCRHVSVFSQVALSRDELAQMPGPRFNSTNTFRAVSAGRLVHWKGFEYGLRAFALALRRFPDSTYWLIGDGPERIRLAALVRTLGIVDHVRFLGAMPRRQVLENVARCDLLIHPSLHDSGSCICVEAMATGVPVVCLDLGGPALQVNDHTGVKVPARSPQQVIEDLAEAISSLAADPLRRACLGTAAAKQVRERSLWEAKGELMASIYNQVLQPKVPPSTACTFAHRPDYDSQ